MPFKSKAQMRMLFATDPKMAQEWADKTPDIKALPEKVKRIKKAKPHVNLYKRPEKS